MLEAKLRELVKHTKLAKDKDASVENVTRYTTLKNILEIAQNISKENNVVMTNDIIIDVARKEINKLIKSLEHCKDDKRKLEINIAIKTAGRFAYISKRIMSA